MLGAVLLLHAGLGVAAATDATPRGAASAAAYLQRPPQDEILYFLLPDRFENGDPSNDRGGLTGDRLQTGYDPTDKGFYHGGDLKGLAARLDYIQGLGATAIWLGPVFRNQPVQGEPGRESAGYHGYWITDFTHVDPHFGTDADFAALVRAVHARGMKLYMDIVVNHTADIIRYRECPDGDCPYRSLGNFPYSRRGGIAGAPINDGFAGDGDADPANWARLTRPDYAYTPYVPAGSEHLKVPGWLNDPIHYHNRGNSTFAGESSTYGDFAGLDDLMTEDPRVLRGFIDIYGEWISRYRIDGFRIDTAKHVDARFWQAFVPAMLRRAAAAGIPHFHIFGEVSSATPDVALLAAHTRVDHLPAVLDFAFATAVQRAVAGDAGTDELARVYAGDVLYEGGRATALQLPTFVSNHDDGRFAWQALRLRPGIEAAETLARTRLAHALLLTLRGVPVIYSGDEQGFVGHGGDQAARQDMFPSRVASYNDQPLLGTARTTADGSFDVDHPLYRQFAELARLRLREPALLHGTQDVLEAGPRPGLLAIARRDARSGREVLLLFNTSTRSLDAHVRVDASLRRIEALLGRCETAVEAPGSYHAVLAPLDFAVCAGGRQ